MKRPNRPAVSLCGAKRQHHRERLQMRRNHELDPKTGPCMRGNPPSRRSAAARYHISPGQQTARSEEDSNTPASRELNRYRVHNEPARGVNSITSRPRNGYILQAEELWGARDPSGLVRNEEFEAKSGVDGEIGCEVGAPLGMGLLTPYAGLTLRNGAERTLRSGVRWRASQNANRPHRRRTPPERHQRPFRGTVEGETDCIRQHARGSRCFTGRTNRDMSVIKPDAGDIKHRPFGTHLWRKPEGQEFGSATVGRARACSDAVMAMHSAPTTISTPTTAG